MKIINASYEILTPISKGGIEELKRIEIAGKACYKSVNITEDGESAKKFVAGIIKSGHHSVIEHSLLSVRFIVDRSVTHEIVRHRIASYSQESQRYCNYGKDKFDNQITFIKPCFWDETSKEYEVWCESMRFAEESYLFLIQNGSKPEEARSVLPNSCKTEIVMTANYREWRNFLTLRTANDAHPQIREVARPLLDELKEKIPVVFDDITY